MAYNIFVLYKDSDRECQYDNKNNSGRAVSDLRWIEEGHVIENSVLAETDNTCQSDKLRVPCKTFVSHWTTQQSSDRRK